MFCHSNQYMLTLHIFNHLRKEKWLMSPNVGLAPFTKIDLSVQLRTWMCCIVWKMHQYQTEAEFLPPSTGAAKVVPNIWSSIYTYQHTACKRKPFHKGSTQVIYIYMDTMSWFILFLWMRWKSINKYTKQKTRWAKFM